MSGDVAGHRPGIVRGRVRAAVTVVLGLALGWMAISIELATRALQAGQPATALLLNPRSARAASLLAQQALIAGDRSTAERYAVAAVARAPYTAASVRTLGVVAGAAGDEAASGRWMGVAGALGWRDFPTQIWLADRLLVAGRYDEAMPRLDALLRQPASGYPILRALNDLMLVPAARAALVARLVVPSEWRIGFLGDMTSLPPQDYAGRNALIAALDAAHAPVSRAELQPYVGQLYAVGRQADARRLWLTHAGDRRAMAASGLYDGDFEVAADGVHFPFEWSIPDEAAGVAAIDPDPSGNPSLRISSTDGAPGVLVAQMLNLPPGRYELATRGEGALGSGQLGWGIRCDRSEQGIAVRDPGGIVLGRSVVGFVVPPTGCAWQALELRATQLKGGGPIEMRIDDVAIRRPDAG